MRKTFRVYKNSSFYNSGNVGVYRQANLVDQVRDFGVEGIPELGSLGVGPLEGLGNSVVEQWCVVSYREKCFNLYKWAVLVKKGSVCLPRD